MRSVEVTLSRPPLPPFSSQTNQRAPCLNQASLKHVEIAPQQRGVGGGGLTRGFTAGGRLQEIVTQDSHYVFTYFE